MSDTYKLYVKNNNTGKTTYLGRAKNIDNFMCKINSKRKQYRMTNFDNYELIGKKNKTQWKILE